MRYLLRKILGLVITLFLVSIVTFAVFQILPGDPAEIILGVDADPNQIAALNRSLGLDRPIFARYLSWIIGFLHGDLGNSLRYQQPVSQLIRSGAEVTGTLALYSIVLTVLIGIPAGIAVSRIRRPALSAVLNGISQVFISIPSFCVGITQVGIFAVNLHWFPSIGWVEWSENPIQSLYSLTLPAFSIAAGCSAIVIRYIRVSVHEEEKKDYVRTAYAKGLSESHVMYRHVLRNSLIPVITILGLLVADILGGSIIIENIFSLPGIGRLISVSISSRDLPLIQGLVMYLAAIVVLCGFGVDLLYAVIDPRIRLK
ncbi:MAG: ABC transporter permease [Solobacterium sp.]|jgi:peptide/nickel transport system permease protein|nr:ABC transporter permease [Solobacterium sp.]